MDVIQIKLRQMATFCYIIGDEETKTCALIDPAFQTGMILEEAEKRGYAVTHLINTHCHSDHTAGNAAVMKATDAKLHIHELDAARMKSFLNRTFSRLLGGNGSPQPDVLLNDGDDVVVGKTVLSVLHTPGHTPGGISLYGQGNVFTGDTLFVGAVGRTDLPGGSYDVLVKSVREKIYTLPDDTVVWPGHDYGVSPSSTVVREKTTNPFT